MNNTVSLIKHNRTISRPNGRGSFWREKRRSPSMRLFVKILWPPFYLLTEVRLSRESFLAVGLRGVRDRSRNLVGHRAVLWLYGKQAGLHVRVPDGWTINVSPTCCPVSARQLHVCNHATRNSGGNRNLRHSVLGRLGVLLYCHAVRRLRFHSGLLSASTDQRVRG